MRRSNPFEEFETLFERMSRQFDEMSRQFDGPTMGQTHGIQLDVSDYDEEFVVVADVPGFEKEDIDLSVANRSLTIEAAREMREDEESETGEYIRRERRHESLRRTVRLPEEILADDATASYKNGVLTVTLPKVHVEESDDSHRIDID
jgi:HSP20 family protein